MIFFAIFIALLIEQARPLAVDNPVHGVLQAWTRWLRGGLDTGQGLHAWLAWLFGAAVPALLTALVYWVAVRLGVLAVFLWVIAVLYLTVGFRQFSHHFTEIRQALEEGNEAQARAALKQWQGIDTAQLSRAELLCLVIQQSALAAHRHVFGVLGLFVVFWWLGLGPAGAVFYRMAEYLAREWRASPDGTPSAALQHAGSQAWQWIDYLPARATAVGFAVVGNFEEALSSWREEASEHAQGSDGVVLAALAGALNVRLSPARAGTEDAEPSLRAEPQLAHLTSAVGLVWRSVVLWMLLLALLTLARLLG